MLCLPAPDPRFVINGRVVMYIDRHVVVVTARAKELKQAAAPEEAEEPVKGKVV